MMPRERLAGYATMAALPLLVLVVWELSTRMGLVSAFLLPTFSGVVERFIEDVASGTLPANAAATLVRLAVSYGLAGVLGVALGIMMARVPFVRWLLDPIVSIGFPAPKIAFLPIFVLWFGVFDAPKIVMCVVSCIFPVIGGTWSGTQGVDKYLIWSAENLGEKRGAILWRIVLPAALPSVFTALQVALPIAFITIVVAEMLTGGGGLGAAMMEGARLADPRGVFANLAAISLLGFLAMKGLQFLRRRVLIWHEEVQREESIL